MSRRLFYTAISITAFNAAALSTLAADGTHPLQAFELAQAPETDAGGGAPPPPAAEEQPPPPAQAQEPPPPPAAAPGEQGEE
ncbi:hypothetical protein, partial [Hyphomicrobium sp.]|uniref:hypothetical protein n=1 Tax=Hyphomicrobium sp. TaxID=82 RepID=UPI00132834EF